MNPFKSLFYFLPLSILVLSLNSPKTILNTKHKDQSGIFEKANFFESYLNGMISTEIKVAINEKEINYNLRYNFIRSVDNIKFEAKIGKKLLFISSAELIYYTQKQIKGNKILKKVKTVSQTNTSPNVLIIKVADLINSKDKIKFTQIDILLNKVYDNNTKNGKEIPFSRRTYSFKFR